MQGDEMLTGEKSRGGKGKEKVYLEKFRAERCPFGALPVLGYKAYHSDLC